MRCTDSTCCGQWPWTQTCPNLRQETFRAKHAGIKAVLRRLPMHATLQQIADATLTGSTTPPPPPPPCSCHLTTTRFEHSNGGVGKGRGQEADQGCQAGRQGTAEPAERISRTECRDADSLGDRLAHSVASSRVGGRWPRIRPAGLYCGANKSEPSISSILRSIDSRPCSPWPWPKSIEWHAATGPTHTFVPIP